MHLKVPCSLLREFYYEYSLISIPWDGVLDYLITGKMNTGSINTLPARVSEVRKNKFIVMVLDETLSHKPLHSWRADGSR